MLKNFKYKEFTGFEDQIQDIVDRYKIIKEFLEDFENLESQYQPQQSCETSKDPLVKSPEITLNQEKISELVEVEQKILADSNILSSQCYLKIASALQNVILLVL